jgi:hypothetical protein
MKSGLRRAIPLARAQVADDVFDEGRILLRAEFDGGICRGDSGYPLQELFQEVKFG